MSNPPMPGPPGSSTDSGRVGRYNDLIAEASARLDTQLANIRRDHDAGDITVIEAADERIIVMTEHLNRLRLLREEYLQ
jgi:hypothetical protein